MASTTATTVGRRVRERSRPWEAAAVAIATVVPGFVVLALLGSLGSYPRHLPGFWDYPSGTIGDGVLLPVLVTSLYVQVRALGAGQRPSDRRLVLGGFVIGAVGGAIVPLSWVLNSHTGLMWLLPRPNHYDTAGWVHAAYLTVSTGVIAALAVLVCARARRLSTGPTDLPTGWSPRTVATVIAAGLGMLVLIGRDAVVGGATVASATTIAGLVLIALALLSGLTWSVRGIALRQILFPTGVVTVFVAGVIAVMIGWPPRYPAFILLGTLACALAAAGACTLLEAGRRAPWRWLIAAAVTVVLVGGLVRADAAFFDRQARPFLWVAGSVVLVVALLAVSSGRRDQLGRCIRYGLFFGYSQLLFFLTARLQLRGVSERSAGASLALADTAFDVMVFALIQTRFGGVGEGDRLAIEAEYVDKHGAKTWRPQDALAEDSPDGDVREPGVMIEICLLGFAVAIGLMTLLSAAAGPLGLNRYTVAPAGVRSVLVAGATAASIVMLAARWQIRRWRSVTDDPIIGPDLSRPQLPSWYWRWALLPAAIWTATIVVLGGETVHVPLLGAAVGVTMFVLYAKSLTFTSFASQTLQITRGQVLLCVAIAFSLALGDGWFISMGIWQGAASLSGVWLAATAFAVFLGNFAVFVTVADTFAFGLPARRRKTQRLLAREAASEFALLDGAVYGLNVLICVALPVYAATRDQRLHGATLNVIASLVFVPGLLTAVIWGMENLRAVDRVTRDGVAKGLPTTLLLRTGGDWTKAVARDRDRVRGLHRHWMLQRYGAGVLMAVGLTYLALVLLRA